MGGVALGIACAAALAAIASAVYARRLARQAERANDLLAEQVHDQTRTSSLERAAELSALAQDTVRTTSQSDAWAIYAADIQNVGRSAATQCTVWIEQAVLNDEERGARFGDVMEFRALGPGQSRRFVVKNRIAGGAVKREGVIVARWIDGNGEVDRRVIGSIDILL
jgi:hypothetical protein